jgi:hypothetical protein
MQKQSILDVDSDAVTRYALGGLLAGGSGAALLNLIRMARDAVKERKQLVKPPMTDEDTIVITLPRKQASRAEGTLAKETAGDKYTSEPGLPNDVSEPRTGGKPGVGSFLTAAGGKTAALINTVKTGSDSGPKDPSTQEYNQPADDKQVPRREIGMISAALAPAKGGPGKRHVSDGKYGSMGSALAGAPTSTIAGKQSEVNSQKAGITPMIAKTARKRPTNTPSDQSA